MFIVKFHILKLLETMQYLPIVLSVEVVSIAYGESLKGPNSYSDISKSQNIC